MSVTSGPIPLSGDPTRSGSDPDAHGQAALLLVESLIHGLIDRAVLSVEDAIEIIDVAAVIKVEMAEERHERAAVLAESLTWLDMMATSLRRDAAGGRDPRPIVI